MCWLQSAVCCAACLSAACACCVLLWLLCFFAVVFAHDMVRPCLLCTTGWVPAGECLATAQAACWTMRMCAGVVYNGYLLSKACRVLEWSAGSCHTVGRS
jgi:hypothetical protein